MASSSCRLLPGEVFFNSPHIPVRIDSVPADSLRLWDSSRVMPVIDAVIRYPSQASDFVQGKFLRHGSGLLSLPLSECGFKNYGEEIPRSLSQRHDGVRKS